MPLIYFCYIAKNIYTNDQPIYLNARNFLYTDFLCTASQRQSFEVKTLLTSTLSGLILYYAVNYFWVNTDKTPISAFHLQKGKANHQLKINWYRKQSTLPSWFTLGILWISPLHTRMTLQILQTGLDQKTIS